MWLMVGKVVSLGIALAFTRTAISGKADTSQLWLWGVSSALFAYFMGWLG